MTASTTHSIVLKSKEGPVVTATYNQPLRETVHSSDFDLSDSMSVMMFVISLNLAGRISRFIEEIRAENLSNSPVEDTESSTQAISLKEIVRRSMGQMNLETPAPNVETVIQTLTALLMSGEVNKVTY